MTVISRRIRATPERSATEVWRIITSLLVPQGDASALEEFAKASGVASYLIEAEAARESPIVIWGVGPRVRIYCLYGEDAVSGEDANEQALPSSPTDGDWNLSLPAPEEDLNWTRENLQSKGISRISTRGVSEEPAVEDKPKQTFSDQGAFSINEEIFRRL